MGALSFNLVDSPWIPVVGVGNVGLRDLFTHMPYPALGGTPVQKIAITKLLLAIAQSAYTPQDDEDWAALQPIGLAQHCLAYVEQWRDRFDLYGEQPFLQMPAVRVAKMQPFGAVQAEIATGNTTILTQTHIEQALDDGQKALLLMQLMGFALGGKKTDNSIVLSKGYIHKSNDKGKPSTGSVGPSLGFKGFLHNFYHGASIMETLWMNLLTQQDIGGMTQFPQGLGTAPWEEMPEGEACAVAQKLKESLMGRLIPLSRFCLIAENGLHYSEGILYASYKEKMADPSVCVDESTKDAKVLWVDPEKRPWRQVTALLNFLAQRSQNNGFDCLQLHCAFNRTRLHQRRIGIWSGGLAVSSNAGEQYVSGGDDFVESLVTLETSWLNENWFAHLHTEMEALERLSKIIYSATLGYFKSQLMEGKAHAARASHVFWQLCERHFNDVVEACDTPAQLPAMRKIFAAIAQQAYDTLCPCATARQLDEWAKNRPNLSRATLLTA